MGFGAARLANIRHAGDRADARVRDGAIDGERRPAPSTRVSVPWYDVRRRRGGRPRREAERGGGRMSGAPEERAPRSRLGDPRHQRDAHFRALVTAGAYAVYCMSPDWSELRHLDGQGVVADTERPTRAWVEAYVDPEDRPGVLAAIEAAIREKRVLDLEHRVRRPDGTLGWVHSRAVPILDAQGEIVEWLGAAGDVTARKEAEAALRESEERLRLATSAARISTFQIDVATGTVEFDANTLAVLYGPASEAPDPGPRSWQQLVQAWLRPEDARRHTELLRATMRGEGDLHNELLVRSPATGEEAWIEAWATLVRDAAGGPGRVVGIMHNVTARKRAEEAAARAERRAERIIERMGDAHCVLDRAFRIVSANAATERLLGVPRAALLGRSYWEAFPASVDAPVGQAFRRVVAEGVEQHLTHHYTGDGYDLHLEVDAYPTDDGGVAMFWRDVTERVRAEAALRDSERRLMLALDAAQAGTWELAPHTGAFAASDRALELHGFPPGTRLTNEQALSMVHPEDRGMLEAAIRRTISGGAPLRVEHRVRHADGSERWVASFAELHDTASGQRVFGLVQDVTARKRAEDALHESEERHAFLLKLSDALRAEPDADAVADRAIGMLSDQLRLDRCGIATYRAGDDRADVTHQIGNASVPPLPDSVRVSDFPGALERVRDRTVAIDDDLERRGRSEAEDGNGRGLGMRAMVASTGRKGEDGPISVLLAGCSRPRRWARGEIALVEEVAERTWAAMERARAEETLRESEERYAALFAASPVPLMVLAPTPPDFTITAANDAYLAVTMTTREGLIGRRLFDVFTDDPDRPGEHGPDALARSLDRVLTTRRPDAMPRTRCDIATPGGGFEPHWWLAINAPMLDAAGNVVAIIHQVTRVTELQLAEEAEREGQERQAFLLSLSDALRALPDGQAIKDQTVKMVAEHLRLDRCWISEVFEQQGVSTVGPEHHRPDLPPMAGVFRLADYPETMRQLVTQPMVISDVPGDARFSEPEKELLAGWRLQALLVAPLRMGQHGVIWALVAAMDAPRDWTEGERALLEDVAERAWGAVELLRPRRRAEELNAFLVRFSDAVRGLSDAHAIEAAACRMVAEELGVERAYWAEVDWTTREFVIGGAFHRPDVPVIAGRFPFGAWEPLASSHRAGRPVVVDATQADARIPPEVREGYARLAVGADLAVPVLADGQLRCTLAVNQRLPRHWTPEEVALVSSIAGRCWAEAERARAEAALAAEREQLAVAEAVAVERRTLLGQIVRAQEEERRRIAHEVHDSVTQLAHAAALRLDDLADRLAPSLSAEDRRDLERARDLARAAAGDARRLIAGLRPETLDQSGLVGALRAEVLALRAEGWKATFRDGGLADVRLDEETEITLYRVAQEALTNVRKHAGRTSVSVAVQRKGAQIRLAVHDRGRGFDPAGGREGGDPSRRLGLVGMRERVELLGGRFDVQSAPGRGTRIELAVPIHQPDDASVAHG
jgi:PAS domain S-box-containing protein